MCAAIVAKSGGSAAKESLSGAQFLRQSNSRDRPFTDSLFVEMERRKRTGEPSTKQK
jgi:hypothetical protein